MLRLLVAHAVMFGIWGVLRGTPALALLLMLNPLVVAAALGAAPRLGRRPRAVAVTIGLLTCSAYVVHFMDGAIEGHFHFFVMVTLLALYEEWFTYILAFAYVLAHHGIVGQLLTSSVFNHHQALQHPWRWTAVHALFIAGLGVVNLVSWRLNENARARTAESEERFRTAFDDAPTAMAIVAPDGAVQRVNEAMCRRTGFTAAEFAGVPLSDLLLPDDRASVHFPDLGTGAVELRYRRRDGSHGWGLWHQSAMSDAAGRVVAHVIHCVDMTKRKQMEARLAFQASHDGLTGLPSREVFTRALDAALQRRRTMSCGEIAVLFVDVDNFKLVNDTLGHEVGDRLLTAVAHRLRRALRPSDVIARFGGDEFMVLLAGIDGRDGALQVAERIGEALDAAFVLDGQPRYVSASVGVRVTSAVVDEPDLSAEAFLRDADIAMYRAKELGRGRCEVFDAPMGEAAAQRFEIENGLRVALAEGQFRLEFQPVVTLDDGSLAGVEALIRWHHPERGVIPPMSFIPAAERNGLIVPIGEWVIREACRRLAEWGDDTLTMAVNVSVRQLASEGLRRAIVSACEESGIVPQRLCLEITETATTEDFELLSRTLAAVKELGVRIAIDDFGTGYATLRNLRRQLPIDTLKIDRSFVAGVTSDVGDATIVEGVVRLAHALGLDVVAEGVETREQASLLRRWRCTSGQGYLFARPVDADAIAAMLERSRPRVYA